MSEDVAFLQGATHPVQPVQSNVVGLCPHLGRPSVTELGSTRAPNLQVRLDGFRLPPFGPLKNTLRGRSLADEGEVKEAETSKWLRHKKRKMNEETRRPLG